MNKFNISAIVLAISLAYSVNVMAQTMSKAEYKAAEQSIMTEYKSAKATCGSLTANAKDICIAEAKGKEMVAKAELEARHKPSHKASHEVSVAKAEADYAVAKERCDDKTGSDKDACMKAAKTALESAKTDANAQLQTSKANSTTKTTMGTKIDDTVVTTRVKSALLADSSIKSFDITVETRKGEVQLSGFVDNQTQIDRAIEIAHSIAGVQKVTNKMSVKK